MNQWGFGRVVDDVYGCPEVSVNRSGPGSRGGAGGDGGGGVQGEGPRGLHICMYYSKRTFQLFLQNLEMLQCYSWRR